MEMFRTVAKAWNIPDLRKKIIFTLAMLLIFRIGSQIPVPGMDREILAQTFDSETGLFALFNLFSGGEKSLAAMALLFSVLKVQPSPFCIYDEVEAALDDVNVERFAKYMRRMTDKTQFISITHRRGTMEEADVLYGVTMQEKGVSKLLELQSAELAQQMGLEA